MHPLTFPDIRHRYDVLRARVTLMAAYPTAAKRDERHPTCRACDPNPRYDERTDRQHLRQFVSRIA